MSTSASRRVFFGVALTSLCIVVAAIALVRMVFADAWTTTLAYHQTLGPRQAVELTVPGDLGAGVRVYGWDKNSVELSARARGEFARRVIMTHANGPNMRLGFGLRGTRTVRSMFHLHATHLEVVLHVPRRATLSVSIISGAVAVNGVTGPLSVTNVNGPIVVAGVGSVLALHCTSGPVSANISDLSAVPDVDITTVAGPVDVRVPHAFRAEVDVDTVVGPLHNELPSTQGPGSLHASSTAGPVSVGYN